MLRRALLGMGIALFALGVVLSSIGLRLGAGRGFRLQSFAGRDGCHGETSARVRLVSEPFLREAERPPGCERFTAFALVERRRLSGFELVSLGGARLRVDGRLLITHRGSPRLAHAQGQIWLERGVHEVEIEQEHADGVSYLRVHEDDLSDSHFKYGQPPLERRRYFADRAHAQRALDTGLAPARPGRALIAFLAWIFAGACVWLAWRAGRERALPLTDFALASALSLLALFVRARGIARQDVAWDELAYALAGRHYVRSLQLSDFASDAFRYNYYHPPLAKWLYGLGFELGAQDGARMVSAVLSAASVGICYAAGKLLFGQRIAFAAAAISVWLPGLVAHARVSGLESVLVFFWLLSLLGAICWLRALEPPAGAARRTALGAAFFCGACAALACGARLTAVWIAPLLLLVFALPRRLPRGTRASSLFAFILGASLAAGLLLLLWPWLLREGLPGLHAIRERWHLQATTEIFLGRDRAPPPAGYYLAAFGATTPALLLGFASLGAAFGLRAPQSRRATTIALAALCVPFLQSVSPFRQDLARYVIQAWPALALLAALAADALALLLGSPRLPGAVRLSPRGQGTLQLLLAVALPLYTAAELQRVEPYPLDYFGELVGGPSGVARSHAFELAWWGEGFRDAIDYVNRMAPAGQRVQLALTPDDTAPRLRDGLIAVSGPPADFVVTNHYKFQPLRPSRACALVHTVAVAGAPLVDVYRCPTATRRVGP